MTEDIVQVAEPWLQLCACCDLGFPSNCTCPMGDYRNVMLALVREIERLREVKR